MPDGKPEEQIIPQEGDHPIVRYPYPEIDALEMEEQWLRIQDITYVPAGSHSDTPGNTGLVVLTRADGCPKIYIPFPMDRDGNMTDSVNAIRRLCHLPETDAQSIVNSRFESELLGFDRDLSIEQVLNEFITRKAIMAADLILHLLDGRDAHFVLTRLIQTIQENNVQQNRKLLGEKLRELSQRIIEIGTYTGVNHRPYGQVLLPIVPHTRIMIDGPISCGKSTLAHLLAKQLTADLFLADEPLSVIHETLEPYSPTAHIDEITGLTAEEAYLLKINRRKKTSGLSPGVLAEWMCRHLGISKLGGSKQDPHFLVLDGPPFAIRINPQSRQPVFSTTEHNVVPFSNASNEGLDAAWIMAHLIGNPDIVLLSDNTPEQSRKAASRFCDISEYRPLNYHEFSAFCSAAGEPPPNWHTLMYQTYYDPGYNASSTPEIYYLGDSYHVLRRALTIATERKVQKLNRSFHSLVVQLTTLLGQLEHTYGGISQTVSGESGLLNRLHLALDPSVRAVLSGEPQPTRKPQRPPFRRDTSRWHY